MFILGKGTFKRNADAEAEGESKQKSKKGRPQAY